MNIKKELEEFIEYHLKRKEEKRVFQSVARSRAKEELLDLENTSINEYINQNKENDTFQTLLFSWIDKQDKKDSEIYRKVNIDRRLFSKIRSNKDYHPSKETVILLGIALELSEEELEVLLESASYSLPKNTIYDLIIRFCFQKHIYDIHKINEFLFEHKCKLLNDNE